MDGKLTIKPTYQQAHNLFMCAAVARLPKSLGKINFELNEQMGADMQISKFYLLLQSHSPMNKFDRMPCFGEKSNWRPGVDPTTGRPGMVMIDPNKIVHIDLDEDQKDGCYWILLLMTHPAMDGLKQIPAVLTDTVWPIAEIVGATRQLRKDLGLDEKPPRKINYDNAPEWGKEQEPTAVVKSTP